MVYVYTILFYIIYCSIISKCERTIPIENLQSISLFFRAFIPISQRYIYPQTDVYPRWEYSFPKGDREVDNLGIHERRGREAKVNYACRTNGNGRLKVGI